MTFIFIKILEFTGFMNFHQKTLYRKDYFRNSVTLLETKGKQHNRTLERIFLLRGNDFLK